MLIRYTRASLLASCFAFFSSQVGAADLPNLQLPRIDGTPTLDDFAGMAPATPLARSMVRVDSLQQRLPVNGAPASERTEVYLGYDTENLYAIFLAFDSRPDLIRATMSSREVIDGDDTVELVLDTFADQRTAYAFRVTPLGLQWDARWTEGGSSFDSSWEAVWYSDGTLTDQGYITTLRIPLTSLRFPSGDEQTWRIQVGRRIPRLSEESYWPAYSLELEGRLNQTAMLTGLRGVEPGNNMMFIPYLFSRSADTLSTRAPGGPAMVSDQEYTVGMDAKLIFNDSWVLDLTLNPDFSQVESDEPQVTVNERFEVQFPERRPFFIENADFFSTDSNLVFTRRIVDPEAGLRFTGRSNGWGFGAIVMNDVAPGKNRDEGDPLKDEEAFITVLRGFRDLSDQNHVGVLFTDRELGDGYNRVASIDGRIKLNPNWVTTLQVIGTDTKPLDGGASYTGAQRNFKLDRSGRTFNTHIHYIATNHGFVSQLGFGNRNYRPDTYGLHGNAQWNFYPEDSWMIRWASRFNGSHLEDSTGTRLYQEASPMFVVQTSTTETRINFSDFAETLRPHDFAGLPTNTTYHYKHWNIAYDNSMLSSLIVNASYRFGTALNTVPALGMMPDVADTTRTDVTLLWRPIDRLRVKTTYLDTDLEMSNGDKVFTNRILRSTWNYQFNKELSLRFIGQYDHTDAGPATRLETSKNLNFDLLLRYVINPWSAFYVGYNSNSRNFDIIEDEETGERELIATNDLRQDGEQFFVKFSYMWQY